ncbi:MAG: histidine kinase dimerization/phospho-acceptor domain-containing protein, partial [Myxococcota bacterium]
MIRFIFVFTGAIGLILLMAFVAARLARVRTEGISVRLQIFIALAFIVGAFAFGLGLLVLDRIEARATRIAKEAASDEAAAIATFVAGQIDATGTSLRDIVDVLEFERRRGSPTRSRLALYDARGRELFLDGPRPDQPGTVAVRAPIQTRSGVVGYVQVVKETIIMRRLLADFAPIVFLISAILGAAAALAAALIGREIASPIESLTYFAERVSEGDRSVTPPVPHGLEVKKLTRAIDKMRRELDGLPYVESFAADLSHELKNPVAAIRASAEVLDDGALAEPEEAARFVKRIREATSRIEAILSELLSLARIEARGVGDQDTIELDEVVRSSIEA